MKYFFTLLTIVFLSFNLCGQLDDQSFQFKRTILKVGTGSHLASRVVSYRSTLGGPQIGISYRNIGIEREVSKHFSASFTYRFANQNRFSYNYKYDEFNLMVNYLPFGFHKAFQVKLSGGIVQSTKQERYPIGNDSFAGTTNPELGLMTGLECGFRILPSIYIGATAYGQLKGVNNIEPGFSILAGVAF